MGRGSGLWRSDRNLCRTCDGQMKQSTLEQIIRARKDGRAIVRAVNLQSGEERLIEPDSDVSALALPAQAAARADRSGLFERDGQNWFLSVHNPPLDLVIV